MAAERLGQPRDRRFGEPLDRRRVGRVGLTRPHRIGDIEGDGAKEEEVLTESERDEALAGAARLDASTQAATASPRASSSPISARPSPS